MKKNYLYLLQLTLLLCLFGACVQAPQYPIEPEISFVSISKDTMIQGQTKNDDFLYLTLAFTDGDGDFGFPENPNEVNKTIVFTDTRTQFSDQKFEIPYINDNGASNGISGELQIKLSTTCCIFPPDVTDVVQSCDPSNQYPVDEVVWEVYIVDRAGNMSNTLSLPPVKLLCQ